jgi:hypothetical protein
MLNQNTHSHYPSTLPPLTWCECGHISGQHSTTYPHRCATGGDQGCVNHCEAFREDKDHEIARMEGEGGIPS